MEFFRIFSENVNRVEVTSSDLGGVRGCCRDENDDFILALALAGKANVIVSSDKDLLVLHPWRDIDILTSARFVADFSNG